MLGVYCKISIKYANGIVVDGLKMYTESGSDHNCNFLYHFYTSPSGPLR